MDIFALISLFKHSLFPFLNFSNIKNIQISNKIPLKATFTDDFYLSLKYLFKNVVNKMKWIIHERKQKP